ncbi:hypothetical protein [Candidatus Methylomirabilis sp.]|uniref:Uncharacterized protein n=1 Tax=Candidatus Methylomirabilis tolerans TaxID=3123416 RepID=A0AAJ1ETY5_9BACT|nr:hypothetical protein [Candidatus Methylomirabilis sp.]
MTELMGVHRIRGRCGAKLAISAVVTAIVFWGASAIAQTFDSGSTGADGVFNPTCTPTPCTVMVPLPLSGTFNFTTINIPTGVTVKFIRNATNTSVTMLASGTVTIAGTIDGSGGAGASVGNGTTIAPNGGLSGPGGFDGGDGADGINSTTGGTGLGPGGGEGGRLCSPYYLSAGGGSFGSAGGGGSYAAGCVSATSGPTYGTNSLVPLIGGSGGGGGSASFGVTGAGGGGGGGALLIASSGTITFTGTLLARGGNGPGPGYAGGGGSGGAIRLVATSIGGNEGSINVSGGTGGNGGSGGAGRIRIESYTSTATINLVGVPSIDQPGVLALPNVPSLTITSVAGVTAPTSPTGSFTNPDIAIPLGTTNPMTVALAASNIPLGTTVTVVEKPMNGAASSTTSTPLTGTLEASMATATLTIPTNQSSVISASATFTLAALPGVGPVFAQGEEVERVRVEAVMGGALQVAYITKSGREVPAYALSRVATVRENGAGRVDDL